MLTHTRARARIHMILLWQAHEGKLAKLNPNNVWQQRYFLLFDHALLWCTPVCYFVCSVRSLDLTLRLNSD
jgi:hypothetical protein